MLHTVVDFICCCKLQRHINGFILKFFLRLFSILCLKSQLMTLKYYVAIQLLGFLWCKANPTWFHESCPLEMLWYNQITRGSPPAQNYSPTSFPHPVTARSQSETKLGKPNWSLPVSSPQILQMLRALSHLSCYYIPRDATGRPRLQCQWRHELRLKGFTGDVRGKAAASNYSERDQGGLRLL